MAGTFNRKQAGPEWTLPYQYVHGKVPGLHHRNLKSLFLVSILILSDWLSFSPSHVKVCNLGTEGGVVTR